MYIDRSKLNETIHETVYNLEEEISKLNNSGIFWIPEIVIAFEIGKNIFKNRKIIFGTNEVIWERERKINKIGPFDILFIANDKNVLVIEVKLANDRYAYEKDIEKLKNINDNTILRLFCVITDSFIKENNRYDLDDRILYLISKYNLKQLDYIHYPLVKNNAFYDKIREPNLAFSTNFSKMDYKQQMAAGLYLLEYNSPTYGYVFKCCFQYYSFEIIKVINDTNSKYYVVIFYQKYLQSNIIDEPLEFKDFESAFLNLIKKIESKYKIPFSKTTSANVIQLYSPIVVKYSKTKKWKEDLGILTNVI